MHTKHRVIILLLILIVLSSFASARFGYYTEDSLLRVCQCSTLNDSLQVKNTDTQSAIYDLSANLDFVEFSPDTFELAPGDIQEVNILGDVPCESFRKDLEIDIENNLGDEATLTKEFVSDQCQNLQAWLYTETNQILPCETTEYTITVDNIGNFDETYTVSSEYDEYINYANNSQTLAQGERGVITADLQLDCGISGNQAIPFVVKAENNNLQTTVGHVLQVQADYGYELEAETQNNVCEEEAESIPITIENTAETQNNYDLMLLGAPSFASLNQTTISLEGGEQRTVNLQLNVEEGKKLGYYEFMLKTTSEYGSVEKEQNMSLNISDCYELDVKIQPYKEEFCSGEKAIPVTVYNQGLKTEIISLYAYPEFVSFDQNTITLNPGKSQNVSMILDPEDKDSYYELSVRAELGNRVFTEDRAKVKVYSQQSCHKVKPTDNHFSFRRDTQHEEQLKIKNKGLKGGIYDLAIEPGFWITLNQSTVALGPGETKTVTLLSEHTSETAFGEYKANLTIELDGLNYNTPITIQLKDKPWYVKAYNYGLQHPCHAASAILLIILLAALVFTIFLSRRSGRLQLGKFLGTTAVLLVLIVLLGAIIWAFKGTPQLNEPIDYSKESSTYYIWAEDTTLEKELSEIVQDPDVEDKINLSVDEQPDNINVDIGEEFIKFEPDADWYGVTTIVFAATDTEGASATSPEITLEVVERHDYSLWTAYLKLCWYFNWILLLIIFILLGIIGFKKLRVKERKAKMLGKAKEKKTSVKKKTTKKAAKSNKTKKKSSNKKSSKKKSSKKKSSKKKSKKSSKKKSK